MATTTVRRQRDDAHRRGGVAVWVGVLGLFLAGGLAVAAAISNDPLPSWNEGPTKAAIIGFVSAVTSPGSPDYVPPAERVAVFDNDGTLWVEQPMYTQLAFVLGRIEALAPQHPEWQDQQPFKAALEGDMSTVGEAGLEGLMKLVMATHAGMTNTEFTRIVTDWLGEARHPRFERPYTELVYQPMLELLEYLRANGFETYIVSGGGADFMRPWTQDIYGIPPEQVVGSAVTLEYKEIAGEPALVRKPEIAFIDDKEGKPVGIWQHIGRRPILAFGNSDGDLQMLRWTTAGPGRRLGLILHHDDAEREYAYDRKSHFGKLDKALDAAPDAGWVVVSMTSDWNQVFPARGTP
jgi:phosphoglycolate phosphatase-like HAD superfamily hydrolase